MQFVKDFSSKCLDKEQADTLTGYLEAEDTTSGTNFNNITISSGLSNISWGSLSPKMYMEGVPLIDDINETTASITLNYQVSAQDDEDKTEIYDVTEFYRMRYTETRIMLLDFKRSATKVLILLRRLFPMRDFFWESEIKMSPMRLTVMERSLFLSRMVISGLMHRPAVRSQGSSVSVKMKIMIPDM